MLQHLEIYACDENGNQDTSTSLTFHVNPSSVTIDHKNSYNNETGMGSIGSEQKFSRTEPASLTFKTLIDGTGTIRPGKVDVQQAIADIKDLCYSYQGALHEPNKIIVVWGDIYFKGCLNKLDVKYKLFSQEGMLLRAELDLTFGEYMDKTEETREKNQQSPDITHVVVVKAGDRLPMLCTKIYRNRNMVHEIARLNGCTGFRNIQPGTRLVFPPLK